MDIEILDGSGNVVDLIVADAEFANTVYPGRWREVVYVPPVEEQPPEPAPPLTWSSAPAEYWWLDTGPFKDRFDSHGYPGLKISLLALGRTSDLAYGVFEDLNGRAYVDLKVRRAELAQVLAALAAELAAKGKPEFTPTMIAAILDSPTTDYERHIKGLPQPIEG